MIDYRTTRAYAAVGAVFLAACVAAGHPPLLCYGTGMLFFGFAALVYRFGL